jgi:hypothetical protein
MLLFTILFPKTYLKKRKGQLGNPLNQSSQGVIQWSTEGISHGSMHPGSTEAQKSHCNHPPSSLLFFFLCTLHASKSHKLWFHRKYLSTVTHKKWVTFLASCFIPNHISNFPTYTGNKKIKYCQKYLGVTYFWIEIRTFPEV